MIDSDVIIIGLKSLYCICFGVPWRGLSVITSQPKESRKVPPFVKDNRLILGRGSQKLAASKVFFMAIQYYRGRTEGAGAEPARFPLNAPLYMP